MSAKALLGPLSVVTLVALALAGSAFTAESSRLTVSLADGARDITTSLDRIRLPISKTAPAGASSQGFRLVQAALDHGEAGVGESYVWLGLDDAAGTFRLKFFTLRAVGDHGEIWVANNLSFPAGDCRNDGVRNVVTQAQVDYLLSAFDNNTYPELANVFSVPPGRDGSNETIRPLVPATVVPLLHPEGAGDRTVILVDNVQDANYYDANNSQNHSYIDGFFSSQMNDLFDRNVMTVDAFDWLHRTTASPPDEPFPGNNCASAPARPFLYEGTFAREYAHLLEQYADPDETNWVDAGLADWAQTLTGYVNPATPITDAGFDAHVQCFLGWLGVETAANPNPGVGGPENSLTRWGEQGRDFACDYGAAYTMMEFLAGRYGSDFMTTLHRGDANGLGALQEALDGEGERRSTAQDVLHDWSLMVAVDGLVDDGYRILGHVKEQNVTTPTLDATINWDTPQAYASPGAPPNGADYVELRDADGSDLTGAQIESLGFDGSAALPGAGFTVHIVSVRSDPNRITIKPLALSEAFRLESMTHIRRYVDVRADWVGAVVFYDDPSEAITEYAPYRLMVNGVTQPGGGM